MYRIYQLIKTLVTAPPQVLMLHCAVCIMLAASCGALLLWMPGNTYNFFNPCALLFYAFGALFLVVGLLKFLASRGRATNQALPAGNVLLILEHKYDAQSRDHNLLGINETVTETISQPVVFTLPPTGTQTLPLKCSTCQQENLFKVDSQQERRALLTRRLLTAVICCILAALLEFVIGWLSRSQPDANWIFYASIVPALLVFTAGFCVALTINNIGVAAKKLAPKHQIRRPLKRDFEQLNSFETTGATQL